jgi:hypothetical protein
MAQNTVERYFMVCEDNTENSAQFGPYKTAEEAESEAARLGWIWILVYTHTVDEYGHIIDVKTRWYQRDVVLDNLRNKLAPKQSDSTGLRATMKTRAVEVKPMSKEEAEFFAEYEKQITYTCIECGEEIAPGEVYSCPIEHMDGSSETAYFHSDLKRSCPLKWSSKKLIAAGEKLRKILEMFDGESKTSR